jgi:hypothetical protein
MGWHLGIISRGVVLVTASARSRQEIEALATKARDSRRGMQPKPAIFALGRACIARGTGSSIPPPSSRESTNHRFLPDFNPLGWVSNRAFRCKIRRSRAVDSAVRAVDRPAHPDPGTARTAGELAIPRTLACELSVCRRTRGRAHTRRAIHRNQACARSGQSWRVASRAPSDNALSFARAICGCTRPPRPQSVPAITFSRPTTFA